MPPPPIDDAAHGGEGRVGAGRNGPGNVAAGHGSDPDPMRVIEILSHELRSPITTIHLGTKVLREQGHRISQPVRIEVVEAVEEEAERLYRLVEDLLAVARHEGGRAPLPVGPIPLQHWLSGVVAAEVQAFPSLRVRLSIPPDLPPVLADDAALAHVMRNLLANVTRYAPDGMPAEIVAWLNDGGTIRLEVLDRGPGVEAEDAEKVFEPFFRSAAAAAIGSGAGLGLAAAQRLMQAMHGSIKVLPRTGGGARFVLTLPVAVGDADLEEDAVADVAARNGDHGVRRAS
jgi:signal transduction histidine kinase